MYSQTICEETIEAFP